jgi:putative hydrolase of the HAD superfamily
LDLVSAGVKAVLLDALGTLVELQPPAPRLQRLLAQAGFDVSEERAAAGFAAEIAYYLDHHLEGSDRARLERLRDRCAEEMRRALGDLRERGVTLVIASNWDCSLPDWLGPAGITELVDGVVTSAEVGAPKPDPRVFERALAIAGVAPAEALHVGDTVDNDVEGAAAAGVRAVLLQREGEPPAGVEAVRSLRELAALL